MKRVTEDHQGRPVRGVASNYVCDLKVGDTVQVIGPFGSTFLMPNHPKSHIVMICTGTGSAPMRAMTEWRRRLRKSGKFEGGKLMLFFGARTREELPYFGPLQSLPKDFIDINLAFSRTPGQPKRYVQDLMRERAADLAPLLADPNTHFYVCGLKAMEEGVVLALRDVAVGAGLDWDALGAALSAKAGCTSRRTEAGRFPDNEKRGRGRVFPGATERLAAPAEPVDQVAALAAFLCILALALWVLALALCMVLFGSLLTAALVFSVACLAVSAVALPASLTAVVAWALTPAAANRKATAMSAFFIVDS